MRSRNCTQVWCELKSEISVALKFLVKKLEAEDTEAYQEMMRINYETFWEIPMPILVIMLYAILVWARFGKTADLTIIIHYPPLVQTTKTIIKYHVEFGYVQTTWHLMKCDDKAWKFVFKRAW